MRTTISFVAWSIAIGCAAPALAQVAAAERTKIETVKFLAVLNVEPGDNIPAIRHAPFTAEATTEFTQTLTDGNRIERRFTASLARDSEGRTRREQEVAMLGPLTIFERGVDAAGGWGGDRGTAPRFVMITDPVAGHAYTLDEEARRARRSALPKVSMKIVDLERAKTVELEKIDGIAEKVAAAGGRGWVAPRKGQVMALNEAKLAPPEVYSQSLGAMMIEGVRAEGTRTTMTIAAGAIGNQFPIEVSTERWFSPELQVPVLITRRDPRSGDTVYRLTNLVRSEPPAQLFSVPAGYEVTTAAREVKKVAAAKAVEAAKARKAVAAKGVPR